MPSRRSNPRPTRTGALAMVWMIACATGGCDEPSVSPAAGKTAVPATAPAVVPSPSRDSKDAFLPAELEVVVMLIEHNRFEEAQKLIDEALERNAEDGHARFLQGLWHHRQGSYAQAREHFEEAVALVPGFHQVHHFFGYCLLNLGELDAARAELQRHLEAEPQEGDSYFGLGLVEMEAGRLDEAERAFREAIRLTLRLRETDPVRFRTRGAALAKCHARLADIHLARGDYAIARDELLETVAIYPLHYPAYYKLSIAYRRLGEDDLAEQALQDHERVRQQVRPDRRDDDEENSAP